MTDQFASRKRVREEEQDDLQQYAPDTKVSVVNSPHQDHIADPDTTEINSTLSYLTQYQALPSAL